MSVSTEERVLSGQYVHRKTRQLYTKVTEQNGVYTVTNQAGSQYFVKKENLVRRTEPELSDNSDTQKPEAILKVELKQLKLISELYENVSKAEFENALYILTRDKMIDYSTAGGVLEDL